MSEEHPGQPIEEPLPADPAVEVDDDAEPEGAVEVAPGRRMVDVSVVAAERKRIRDVTEKRIRDAEIAPLKAKADQVDALTQAVNELRPYAQFLQQNPHLMQGPKPTSDEEAIPDEQASTYARRYELFTADGTPDVKRAKAIMVDHRRDAAAIAKQAAAEAVAPLQRTTAEQAQRTLFVQMANQLGADDILTPEQLAQQFAELGPEMTQHPEVAQVALERAIGKAYLAKRGRVTPGRTPTFSEAPGGAHAPRAVLGEAGKKMGLTETDIKASAKTFNPDGASEIGSW